MFAKNIVINKIIEALILMISVNVFGYGFACVPIICLLLFIDKKGYFFVKNAKTFIVLLLFSLSFFAFSYKTTVYCVAGFFLPMAYYIGSNIEKPSEIEIKKIIYIIIFGMSLHVLMNLFLDYRSYGLSLFRKMNHYDIWSGEITQQALLVSNCLLSFSTIFYVLYYEQKRITKYILILLFAVCGIYNIGLGRRTPLFILVFSYIFSYIYDALISKRNVKTIQNIIKKLFLILVGIVLMMIIIKYFDLYNVFRKITIVEKIINQGLFNNGRLEIMLRSIKLIPKYVWGGRNIMNILGDQIHNLWFDIYDFVGIIPFVLMTIYTIMYAIVFIRIIKNKNISNNLKLLIIEKDIVVVFLMLMEPAMSGLLVFMILAIMLSANEELINDFVKTSN